MEEALADGVFDAAADLFTPVATLIFSTDENAKVSHLINFRTKDKICVLFFE